MNNEELNSLFNEHAHDYDRQWRVMAPINDAFYFLLEPVFLDFNVDNASVLCVGAGTGKELLFLAEKFPRWRFTVVEPAAQMMHRCREAAENAGIASRCIFHEGYTDSLDTGEKFDAATCFLVSHFILSSEERRLFFQQIAAKLRLGAMLVCSDLAFDTAAENYQQLLAVWLSLVSKAGIADMEKLKQVYAEDMAILPPNKLASMIASAGFSAPTQFYQAGLIHSFYAKKI